MTPRLTALKSGLLAACLGASSLFAVTAHAGETKTAIFAGGCFWCVGMWYLALINSQTV